MAKTVKKICGREFIYDDSTSYESGIYDYRGRHIAKEWFTVGWDHPTRGYIEQDIRRWVILKYKPYHQHHFKSITQAADAIDRGSLY